MNKEVIAKLTEIISLLEKQPCDPLASAWRERSKLYAEGSKLRAKGNKLRAEGYKLHAEGSKLRAEGVKLCAEGVKLYAEGSKLYAEGDILWANAIIALHGPKTEVSWASDKQTCTVNGITYT